MGEGEGMYVVAFGGGSLVGTRVFVRCVFVSSGGERDMETVGA